MKWESWMVTVILYPQKKPKDKHMRILKLDAPNEQTARRLVLKAAHKDEQFVDEFLSLERIKT